MNRRPYAESLRSGFIIQGGGVQLGGGGVDFAAKLLTDGCFSVPPYTKKRQKVCWTVGHMSTVCLLISNKVALVNVGRLRQEGRRKSQLFKTVQLTGTSYCHLLATGGPVTLPPCIFLWLKHFKSMITFFPAT